MKDTAVDHDFQRRPLFNVLETDEDQQGEEDARLRAASVVDNVLIQASMKLRARSFSLQYADPPSIKIDLAGPRTPSPEEEETYQLPPITSPRRKKKPPGEDEGKEQPGHDGKNETSLLLSEEDKVRDFARKLVESIIEQAKERLREHTRSSAPSLGHAIPSFSVYTLDGEPWYVRLVESVVEFVRTLCHCSRDHASPT